MPSQKFIGTAADLAWQAFDYALEKVAARARREVPAYVTREDFEQALIELRFQLMDLTDHEIALQREQHEHEMQALRDRLADERASGDVVDATIIEPTGDEHATRVFPRRPPRKDDE